MIDCVLCGKEITDSSRIIQGILWKGKDLKEDYIEIAICDLCRDRIKETIQEKIDSSPIVKMVFRKYLKIVSHNLLSFLKE